MVSVGRLIVEAFGRYGISVDWNETGDMRPTLDLASFKAA
jgi:hypothetical protein